MRSMPENVIENAQHGERFVITTTTAASNGEVLAFDFFLAPGGSVPMMHAHLKQAESFRCKRGTLTVKLEDGTRTLGPGDELTLPAGTFHALANLGDEEVYCEVEYRPAGRSEDFLKIGGAYIVATGKEPGLLDVVSFLRGVDLYVKGPPLWLQRALFGALEPVAKLLGRKQRMLRVAKEVYGRPFEW